MEALKSAAECEAYRAATRAEARQLVRQIARKVRADNAEKSAEDRKKLVAAKTGIAEVLKNAKQLYYFTQYDIPRFERGLEDAKNKASMASQEMKDQREAEIKYFEDNLKLIKERNALAAEDMEALQKQVDELLK